MRHPTDIELQFHHGPGVSRWPAALALCALAWGAPALAQTQYRAVDLSYAGNYGTSVAGMSGGLPGGYVIYDVYYIDHYKHVALHAIYWPALDGPPVELNPFDSPYSQVSGVSGSRQAGTASVLIDRVFYARAIVWKGSAASARDITVPGYDNSWANGIHGNQVVGQANGSATGGYVHAVAWDLKAGTMVDLHGTGHQESGAVATNGTQQVGWANDAYGADAHAMLWSGSAQSAVDLNPAGFPMSHAYAIDGGRQVGTAETAYGTHAMLWSGTAGSAIDLNPRGYIYSFARGIGGGKQVGYGTKADYAYHALVWSGRANKVVDLQQFLPASLTQSYATSVDAAGNIGGYATDADGTPHAIVWQPLP
jgi:hypothetical protein